MEITVFLAQFWGWLLVIVSLVFLVRREAFLEELFRLVEDKGLFLLSGYLALILGLGTVILHNVWVADWRVIITILGWSSLIKGVVRIGFPEVTQKFMPVFKAQPMLIWIALVIMGFLGVWLIWVSY